MTPSAGTDVRAAVEHLAGRLGVSIGEITVAADEHVTWPDSAAGCRKEGFGYASVLTPGRRVVLQVNEDQYAYLAHRGGPLRYCAHPGQPVPDSTTDPAN